MNFRELNLKTSYRTPENILSSFYIPLLSKAITYRRAVGFFSSSILIEISKGLAKLVENEGKIMLITSPRLQEDDIKAIEEGYEKRNAVIEKALLREFTEPKNEEEKERLNLLSHLIAQNILDIKIAFVKNQNKIGIYHEKLGIFEDQDGNIVAFSGSLNESYCALLCNYEAIDVFNSWENADSLDRVNEKKLIFEKMWKNDEEQLEIIEFPKVVKEKLDSYKKPFYDKDIDIELIKSANIEISGMLQVEELKNKPIAKNIPNCPIELRDYQKSAINEWRNKGYKGIFDMATGTGKTYTGLGALVDLYKYCKGNLAVVICCPFIHLVEQWVEDLKRFNIEPIVGYGASTQKNWKKIFENAVNYHNFEIENKEFFCFITTNDTFYSDFVQKNIRKLNNKSLLMVDEAHYFGSECIRNNLPENFNYRLALSATIERHSDDEGTKAIFDFFGDKCIEYTLGMAITAGMLTPYEYFPILVYLTSEELSTYKALSKTIAKFMVGGDKKHIPEAAKPYLLKRARLVAGAENKLTVLKDEILKYKNDNHILVYCGATTIDNPNQDETDSIRQIQAVCKMLGNDLNMKVAQFTSQENMKDRTTIKNMFARGDMLQVLVAIKCLDEGFNIPEIKTAFILASTTNPKEYIQRRGRVLRLSEGKEYAKIYDFITLPRPVEETHSLTEHEQQYEQGLVKREFERLKEFNRLAENSTENNKNLIWDLIDSYKLYDNSYDSDIL